MNYQHPMNVTPNAHFASAPTDDKTFTPQAAMIGFPTSRNQFSTPWDFQQQPQMVQVVLPFPPQMCYSPHPVYPLSPLSDHQGVVMPDQSVQLPAMPDHRAVPTMTPISPDSVLTPQSPNVPMFVFSPPTYAQHPIQQFPNMPMGMIPDQSQFFAPPVASVSPPSTPMVDQTRHPRNKRTPPGFDNNSYSKQASHKERKPLQARAEKNESETSRRRNNKRKSKKQSEKANDGEYRPSYRSKQDMIDKVFLALSQKYTALGLLENKGLRGDDTIRVHVKNFNALTRIEEALVAVESHPKVKVSRVSLPFSFRNEYQKKGFLVYLKLEDVTMVPHAQSVFRQYDEFKKCGVMRETGQYVESLPLAQATRPSDSAFQQPAKMVWERSASSDSGKDSIPDYASSSESATSSDVAEDSDSEQLLSKPVVSKTFGPFAALASTRQQSMPRKASDTTKVHALMRAARRTPQNDSDTGKSTLADCSNISYADLTLLAHGEAGL